MQITKRFSLAVLVTCAAVGFTSAAALADPATGEHQCEGKGKGGGQARFQKSDTNSDGFLTLAEVGNERWARIKVADANRDNKVSRDELKQARKDGKLPRKNKA